MMNWLYYECDEPIIDSGDEEAFVFNNKVLEELIRNIYLKEVDVVNDIALAPWHEFWRSFNEATDKGIRLAGFNEDDRGFYRELRYNNGVFAAFRTHRLQNDIARQLLDEKGELKPFERFAYDVRTLIAPTHLKAWLQTEYATAVNRAHQAVQWRRFEANREDLPCLKWIESTSIHPGEDHRVFWNTVRLIDDPFWSKHRPGDRWNCKCDLEATDEEPTANPPEGGEADRPSPGLDNNPAKDARLFSDSHPYIKNGYEGAREAVERLITEQTIFGNGYVFKEDIKRQRAEIREWAKENLIGKQMSVPGLDMPISFTSTGIKEALNQPHKYLLEKNEAVRSIKSLLEKGNYVRFDPDVKDNQMVKGYHYYKIEINNEPSYVVIRELKTGELMFYSIVEKIKKKE